MNNIELTSKVLKAIKADLVIGKDTKDNLEELIGNFCNFYFPHLKEYEEIIIRKKQDKYEIIKKINKE